MSAMLIIILLPPLLGCLFAAATGQHDVAPAFGPCRRLSPPPPVAVRPAPERSLRPEFDSDIADFDDGLNTTSLGVGLGLSLFSADDMFSHELMPAANDDFLFNDSPHFNPASGLPMMGDCFDIGGNPYGSSGLFD